MRRTLGSGQGSTAFLLSEYGKLIPRKRHCRYFLTMLIQEFLTPPQEGAIQPYLDLWIGTDHGHLPKARYNIAPSKPIFGTMALHFNHTTRFRTYYRDHHSATARKWTAVVKSSELTELNLELHMWCLWDNHVSFQTEFNFWLCSQLQASCWKLHIAAKGSILHSRIPVSAWPSLVIVGIWTVN